MEWPARRDPSRQASGTQLPRKAGADPLANELGFKFPEARIVGLLEWKWAALADA